MKGYTSFIRFLFSFIIFSLCVNEAHSQSDYYTSLKNNYDRLRKENNQDSALLFAREMNTWAIKFGGDTSINYSLSFRYIGNVFLSMQKSDSAIYYYILSIEHLKRQKNEVHPDYAQTLNNIAVLYQNNGDFKSAEIYYKQALEIRKNILGEQHPNFAFTLDNIGVLYLDMSEYKKAEFYCKQALEIRKNVLGEEHIDFARSLNSLGNLYRKIGDYKQSESYYKKALNIRKKVLGEKHPDFGRTLNNLGILYKDMGNYSASEQCYMQSMEIIKKTLGEEHQNYSVNLNNLGVLYSDIGDYKAAESLYKQALKIRKKNLGELHPSYATSINNLGVLYSNMGDYKAAESLYKQALEIRKKALGEEHRDYAQSINNLGVLYSKIGDHNTAEILYKQALEIRKKALGEEHIDYAQSLVNLGDLDKKLGNYKLAEKYYLQSLELEKKLLGEEHPIYLSLEISLAHLLNLTNRENEAYKILNKNFTKKVSEITNNFEWLNDNQKEIYWKNESKYFDYLPWVTNKSYHKVPEIIDLYYNAALLVKSKMLETKISSENYYREVDELREELGYRRRLLAKMESEGSADKERMMKLYTEADSLDKRLTLSWPEYAQQKKNLTITWDQVQQNLDSDEAAIEFVRFKNEDDSLYYYNALVIKTGDQNPTLIKLCKEKDLTSISPNLGFSSYYQLVWQPLEKILNGIKTIYYSPDGELNNIPFHAIYKPKGKGDEQLSIKNEQRGGVIIKNQNATTEQNAEYLIDRYTLHQLTSTRYLAMNLKQNEKKSIGNDILLVGGVNYEYLPGIKSETLKNKNTTNSNRSSQSGYGKLEYLEGTKIEVEQIATNVSTKKWQVSKLQNNDATEDNIIQYENKEAKSILHIATHGFAFPEFDFRDSTISKNSLKYTFRYSNNPMVRSGLILAGGNWAWTGSDTLTKMGATQNGILTALEVSQLNLKKTKLVVLSACETGIGKIESSEGIFGLKRGFKLAGVEQIIVSLWAVPDKETMELMTLFYTYLSRSLNPVSSFEKAQKDMRSKYPTDPQKWAGFVLVR